MKTEQHRNAFVERLLQGTEVEWKPLGEVVKLAKGKQLNKRLLSDEGLYPAYNGGISFSGFTDSYNYSANKIIISQGGASAGYVNFVTTDFYANAHCYVVLPDEEQVCNKYVFHFLKLNQEKLMGKQLGAGIPALRTSEILELSIPIPYPEEVEKSLTIQRKLVEVLDKFTELEAELEARRKQYEYYRNELFSFGHQMGGGGVDKFCSKKDVRRTGKFGSRKWFAEERLDGAWNSCHTLWANLYLL